MKDSTTTVFKQSSIYGLGNIIRKFSGVIILPLVKVYTSEDEFGVWMLLETIFMFTLVLSGWGVKSGFVRWYNDMKSPADKRSLFTSATAFNYLVSVLISAIIGVLLYRYSAAILKYEVSAKLILLFMAAGLFRLFHDMPFYILRLQQKVAKQTVHSSVNVILLILFTIYFLEIRRLGFEGVFMAQLAANLLTFIGLLPIIKRNTSPDFKAGELKDIIHYGLPLALSNLLTIVLNLSDRHIINQFFNPAESGNYGLAFKVANLLEMVFVSSFITSFTYFYYQSFKNPDSNKDFLRLQRYFVLIIATAGMGIVLFSGEIIWLVSAGDAYYQEGIFLIPILIMGLIFGGLRQFFTLPLHKHKSTKIISRILIAAGLINLTLNLVLVPTIGKAGAAWSTLAVQFISMMWFYYEANKKEAIHFNFKQTIKLLSIWLIIMTAGFYVPDNFWLAICLKALLMAVFVISIIAFRIIQADELNEVIRMGKKLLSKK
ncbi:MULTISPECIES: polysaccharide biosynthesis C-terminal domain-containing protein [unclassified Carboxylicivirga]|uniref:oligosaccharide flippase family protein n=1 Tax=Carboxylicivirga TaxID=1628153 RepID=UPI003D327921